MGGLSKCSGAYCSKGYTPERVRECHAHVNRHGDWNGRCAYQSIDEVCRYCREKVPHAPGVCASGSGISARYGRAQFAKAAEVQERRSFRLQGGRCPYCRKTIDDLLFCNEATPRGWYTQTWKREEKIPFSISVYHFSTCPHCAEMFEYTCTKT